MPEIEVFHRVFERCNCKNKKISIKQHIKYFNFRSIIPLDHPVVVDAIYGVLNLKMAVAVPRMYRVGLVV